MALPSTGSDALLEMIFPFCPCIQTEEFKAKKRRRAMMSNGDVFSKKKHTFGFDMGGSVEFTISVDFEEMAVHLNPKSGKETDASKIKISEIAVVGAKSPNSLTLMSMTGDLLLEVEARNIETRDDWVLGLNEIIPQDSTIRPTSTIKSRTTKQAYFLQKGVELAQKKREADKKKEKYMKEAGGFKFTALAMANRD